MYLKWTQHQFTTRETGSKGDQLMLTTSCHVPLIKKKYRPYIPLKTEKALLYGEGH
uniref:Uncharacterized protein n=1 Tax=Arion vulgaris TaxID=1028688 RepID=A0A0B7B9D5_9EUPU